MHRYWIVISSIKVTNSIVAYKYVLRWHYQLQIIP